MTCRTCHGRRQLERLAPPSIGERIVSGIIAVALALFWGAVLLVGVAVWLAAAIGGVTGT